MTKEARRILPALGANPFPIKVSVQTKPSAHFGLYMHRQQSMSYGAFFYLKIMPGKPSNMKITRSPDRAA